MTHLSTGFIYPEAFKAVGHSALARAFWLEQAAYAARYEALHGDGAPPNLTPEQRTQRQAVLDLAGKFLTAAADRHIQQALVNFKGAV